MAIVFKASLFPLPEMVYFPTLRKPLNVFEPRYIELINDSLEQQTPVILAHGLTEPEANTIEIKHETLGWVKSIAGVGVARLIQGNLEGGGMLITLDPVTKVEILEILEVGPKYNVALCREVVEFETVLPGSNLLLSEVEVEFRKWGKGYFNDKNQYNQLLKIMKNPINLVSSFSEFVIDSQASKQELLELDDINDKIKYIVEWIR